MRHAALLGDIESGKRSTEPSFEFADSIVRAGFVRKVFGILSVQLAITAGAIAACLYSEPVKSFVTAYQSVTVWGAFALTLVTILILSCSESARRSHPLNLILLFAFTLGEASLTGFVTSLYDAKVVLLAVAVTAAVVTSLTLLSLQTKIDVTSWAGVLSACLLALILASLMQFFFRSPWLHFWISVGTAILFSAYLIFDIQLITGSGGVATSPDEYVYGALALYLDILNIFLSILSIINQLSRDRE